MSRRICRLIALGTLGLAACSSRPSKQADAVEVVTTDPGAKELMAPLRQRLDADAASGRFSGAALVAKNGKAIFAEAYGLADREHKVANTVKTRFRLGSMNKMFTAVATLQLAQAGKLGLDEPLGKYLTDYTNKDVAAKVTIHQLLTHTGATGEIFGPEFDAYRAELRTHHDYLMLYGARPPRFSPGHHFEYSNYGFVLLGAVIEKVSGQSYYDYVRDHIYAPAGMSATGSEPEDQAVPLRSVGYTKMDSPGGPARPNDDTLPYRGTSAGGGYSTVEDLLKFANALQANLLLDAKHTALLTAGKVDTGGGRYAYGFEERTIAGTRCFGHGGGAPGMCGELRICPGAPSWVIVVLSNVDPMAASEIVELTANRLLVH